MNIRSITLFQDVSDPLNLPALRKGADVVAAVKAALEDAGYTIQTRRLATQSISAIARTGEQAVAFTKSLEDETAHREINYVCIGPVRASDPRHLLDAIPDVLAATSSIFLGIEIASRGAPLNLHLLKAVGEIVHRVATIGNDGFANLRLAALACVPPWGPFFPSGYHGGGGARIAIATESADLAVTAVQLAQSVEEASANLIQAVEHHAREIEAAVNRGLAGSDVVFQGIDFSLAPYPDQARSIGLAMEALGLPFLGGHGTLMAAAWLTSTLDRARLTRTGFCGLMLPVLEDTVLAGRTSEGHLRVGDLLVYSVVCGTGLDTVPIPGDTGGDTIGAILADVAGLALRLDKPLTARLMPLPGKQAGDPVSFEFEFFAPGRVMEVGGGPLGGLLARSDALEILPRPVK